MNFDECFARLMLREGGYSNNISDPGGETNYGITKTVAQSFGYVSDMKDLPIDYAKHIYEIGYWKPCHCEELPDSVRYDMFDAGVNSGIMQATKWLQRTVGVKEDGLIGPVTIAACQTTPNISSKFNGQRLMFMTDLPTWGVFGRGWCRRIADNLQA